MPTHLSFILLKKNTIGILYQSMWLIIILIVFGYCLVGGKFLDRLAGVFIGALVGLIIIVFILGIMIGFF